MWMLFARAPTADAAYWPGRRWLAAVDAVGWPALWVAAIACAPHSTGIVGRVIATLALVFAVRRVRRAVWRNERYGFTTWTWGVPLTTMVLVTWAIKRMP